MVTAHDRCYVAAFGGPNRVAIFDRNGEPLEIVPLGASPEPMLSAWHARFAGWRARNGHDKPAEPDLRFYQ